MIFDPENIIVKLCAKGMEEEAKGNNDVALSLFLQAWDRATTNFERFTAAHYVARHQNNIEEKLNWDKTSLNFALQIDDVCIMENLPSLYLNIGKCYEDMNDLSHARENYKMAYSYANHLSDNGYGKMIKSGIQNALARLAETNNSIQTRP